MLSAALLMQSYGAYVVLLRDDFGWSKTMLSGAYSMQQAQTGLVGPLQGWLLDRFGPRAVTRVGLVLFGLGFMAFSRVESPLMFFACFFVLALGAGLCGYMSITYAAVQWFERFRSTAIGITSAGYAAGGIAVPLTVLALDHFGWRATAFFSGVILIAVGLPLAQLIRGSPSDMGLHPDGDPPPEPRTATGAGSEPAPMRSTSGDFTLGEAVRTRQFWFISFGHTSALFVVSAVGVHLVSHLKESLGYSLGEASAVVTLMTVLQLVGTLSGGFIGDRTNKRWLVVICSCMHFLALVILAHATNVSMVFAFAILHGLAWGWRGPQMMAIRADYFGRGSFGKIMGLSSLVIIIGTVSGPIIAGAVYDSTGSYKIGFDIIATIALLGSVFFFLSTRPAPPRRAGTTAHGP